MEVGDRKTCTLYFGGCDPKPHTGTVVWIHPERRFYVVRFEFDRGRSFDEAFFFPSRAGQKDGGLYAKQAGGNRSRAYWQGYDPKRDGDGKRSFAV